MWDVVLDDRIVDFVARAPRLLCAIILLRYGTAISRPNGLALFPCLACHLGYGGHDGGQGTLGMSEKLMLIFELFY
jgi:hypothetical protein